MQTKTIEEQGKKQVEALEVLKPTAQKLAIKGVILENEVNEEAKNELNKIKEIEKMAYRGNSYYKIDKYSFDFQNVQTISTLVEIFITVELLQKKLKMNLIKLKEYYSQANVDHIQ